MTLNILKPTIQMTDLANATGLVEALSKVVIGICSAKQWGFRN